MRPEKAILEREGRSIRLQPKQMELLVYLAGRAPEVATRQEVLAAVWPEGSVSDSGLKRNVSDLRRVLGDDARASRVIRTIAKRGYQLVLPVTPLTDENRGADGTPGPASDSGNVDVGLVSAGPSPSVAVLAFADLSPEEDQQYFCDGIAEEIINSLAQLDRLRVVSRTSSFAFKARSIDIREIGEKLGVDTVLEGSVRKAGERLRITTQLIQISDGCQLWSQQFDRRLEDVFRIQEEIARAIVEALEIELNDRERRGIEKAATSDVEAYEFYLRGRQFFYSTKRQGLEYALKMFDRATDQDPGFALAYAGLADCYSFLFRYYGGDQSNLQQADWASRKALQLDPDLAEAHASRGLAISFARRYDEAEAEFKAALRLNPRLFEAYYFYARSCFARGELEKAARLFELAGEVKPDDYQAPSLQAFVYRAMGRPDAAVRTQHRALANAERHLQLSPGDSRALYLSATACVDLGETERGLAMMAQALEIDPDDAYIVYGGACFYAQLGRLEESMRCFEQALATGFAHREWIENDTDLDPIRDDPRFKALLDRLLR